MGGMVGGKRVSGASGAFQENFAPIKEGLAATVGSQQKPAAPPVAGAGLAEAEQKAAKRRARRGRGGPGLLSSESLGSDSATLGSVR